MRKPLRYGVLYTVAESLIRTSENPPVGSQITVLIEVDSVSDAYYPIDIQASCSNCEQGIQLTYKQDDGSPTQKMGGRSSISIPETPNLSVRAFPDFHRHHMVSNIREL